MFLKSWSYFKIISGVYSLVIPKISKAGGHERVVVRTQPKHTQLDCGCFSEGFGNSSVLPPFKFKTLYVIHSIPHPSS